MVWNFLLSDIEALSNIVNYENKPYCKGFHSAECCEEKRVLDLRKEYNIFDFKVFHYLAGLFNTQLAFACFVLHL
jgi:hypothetical protein